MKKFYISIILLIGFSFIFLFQVFSSLVIIPTKSIISFLGQPEDPIGLFFSGLKIILFAFISGVVIEGLYSLGFKIENAFVNRNRIYTQAVVSFTTVWLTFFTYGLLSVFGAIPKIVETSRLFSLYLFWFLIINAFFRIFKKIKGDVDNLGVFIVPS